MADDNEALPADEDLSESEENLEQLSVGSPPERSGHVAVTDGKCMFVWGGYKNAQVRGIYDFYLPRDEIWIYNMETEQWTKHRTIGEVPPSMSGSCAVCMDRIFYLFGGHHDCGNTNKFYMLNSRSNDGVLQWVRVDCQGIPPSSKDKLGVWVYRNKLIFFGGYGYYPDVEQIGTFEFDETSFWNSGLPRGWNNHVHVLDTESFTWSQPLTTGKSPSPRAAHACATVGSRGYVFGGRYRESRMNDLYFLNLETWEWQEIVVQGICPQPLSKLWHTACASDEGEVIVFGGCASNLLAHHKAAHSNEILVFSLQPKSLARLCLEAVMCFKEILASSWHCLPKHLLHKLNQRFGSNNTSGS
uniref:Kelch domain containing 2 n=1 Tax=Naja naja TaxID=35670 RepID=A0A8C6XG40_NAJNA